MKILRLWTLLLVPIFSAQAFAQIDTLTVENDSADTEYMQEEETDDNGLRVQVKGFLDTYPCRQDRRQERVDGFENPSARRGET